MYSKEAFLAYFKVFSFWAALFFVAQSSLATEFPESKPKQQSRSYVFDQIENSDLNALGSVRSMVQDEQGFLWLGGQHGLARFDGYNTRLYQAIDSDPDSICTSGVGDIIIDQSGRLWVASGFGLSLYQKETDNFKCYQHQESDPNSLSASTVRGLLEDSFGNIWISTENGLNRYNAEIDGFDRYIPGVESAFLANFWFVFGKQPLNKIGDMFEDDDGIVWLSCFVRKPKLGGLCRFDVPKFMALEKKAKQEGESLSNLIDQAFTYYPVTGNYTGPSGHNTIHISEDHRGGLWLATWANGLNLFDKKTELFTAYKNDADVPGSLSDNSLLSVVSDSNENIWIGTAKAGVNRLIRRWDKTLGNKNATSFESYNEELIGKGYFPLKGVASIFEGEGTGVLFGGNPIGLARINEYASSFHNYTKGSENNAGLSSSEITGLVEGDKNQLWITTLDGLNKLDLTTGKITSYYHDPDDEKSLPSSLLTSIQIDDDGDIWIGSEQKGVFRFNETQQVVGHYLTHPNLSAADIDTIYKDLSGNIWIGAGSGGGGLFEHIAETGEFLQYRYDSENPHTILPGAVKNILEASTGQFWVATSGNVQIMDPKSRNFLDVPLVSDHQGFRFPYIISLFESSDSSIWLGSEIEGLFQLVPKGDKYRLVRYDKRDGLPSLDIGGILEDAEKKLWVSTKNGLARYDKTINRFRSYNTDHGLVSNLFDLEAAIKLSNGKLAFGSLEGLSVFDPSELFVNNEPPPIVMTDFKLFNSSVRYDDVDSPLNLPIHLTKQITLTHKHQVFSFEFAALDYRFPHLNQYAYKLEGFDKEWQFSGNKRSATYTNLDAGGYTFRVKASNSEGVWNESGVKLDLRILPPWWRTWWAYTIYVLTVIALIAKIIHTQYRKRQIAEEQNRILELKVAERTSELREKNEDIQSMLGNMQQGLFTIDMDGLIHPEYSQYLEEIFEEKDLAKRKAVDFLFEFSNLNEDEFNQMSSVVSVIAGQSDMVFEFNQHLLIREYEITLDADVNPRKKSLELMWNPILEDDTVCKLMVTVRDRTLVKQLEAEAESKKRELDIVGQLLNILSNKFLNFISASRKLLNESLDLLDNLSESPEAEERLEVIKVLFRNMHTVKGSSRTFHFSFISNAAHVAESLFSELKQDMNKRWDIAVLRESIKDVEVTVEEYRRVYEDILGRVAEDQGQDDSRGVWLEDSTVDKLLNYSASKQFKSIDSILIKARTKSLSDVLDDIVQSMPSIAEQLGKEAPLVEFKAEGIRIKKPAYQLLNDTFSHLLRNSLDHGIEPSSERIEKGKSPRGCITISAYAEVQDAAAKRLMVKIQDDGRGLNIDGLYNKGISLGYWEEDSARINQACADLIFESGVSTKQEVSDISGRGVGMDAVKQFLENQGCTVAINIIEDDKGQSSYLKFETVITLPSNMYCEL